MTKTETTKAEMMNLEGETNQKEKPEMRKEFEFVVQKMKTIWLEQQKEAMEDKDESVLKQVIEEQKEALGKMCEVFNIKGDVYLPKVQMEDNIDASKASKIGCLLSTNIGEKLPIKPFIRGGEPEFVQWMERTMGIMSAIVGGKHEMKLAEKICLKMMSMLIPENSSAHQFMRQVQNQFKDEDGNYEDNVNLTRILNEIRKIMKESKIHKIPPYRIDCPKYKEGKENIIQYARKFNNYITLTLTTENVSTCLNNNDLLRKAKCIEFMRPLPGNIIEKANINLNDEIPPWDNIISKFVEAEACIIYNKVRNHDGNYRKEWKMNKNGHNYDRNKGTIDNYNGRINRNENTTRKTKENNSRQYHENTTHNKNPRQSYGYRKENSKNTSRTVHTIMPEKGTMKLNKFALLMCITIIFSMFNSTQAILTTLGKLEDCDKPYFPKLYAMKQWEVEETESTGLYKVDPNCKEIPNQLTIVGAELNNILIHEDENHQIKEMVYTSTEGELCGYNHLIIDAQKNYYQRRYSDHQQDMIREKGIMAIIIKRAKAFNTKCPDTSNNKRKYGLEEAKDFKLPPKDDSPAANTRSAIAYREKLEEEFIKLKIFAENKEKQLRYCKFTEIQLNHKIEDLNKEISKEKSPTEVANLKETNKKLEQELLNCNGKMKLCEKLETDNIALKNKIADEQLKLKKVQTNFKERISRENHEKAIKQLEEKITSIQTKYDQIVTENNINIQQNQQLEMNKIKNEGKIKELENQQNFMNKMIKSKEDEILDIKKHVECSFESTVQDRIKEYRNQLSKCIEDAHQFEKNLKNEYLNERNEILTKTIQLEKHNKQLTEHINQMILNGAYIRNEIESFKEYPNQVIHIKKTGLTKRLNTMLETLDTSSPLEYTNSEEIKESETIDHNDLQSNNTMLDIIKVILITTTTVTTIIILIIILYSWQKYHSVTKQERSTNEYKMETLVDEIRKLPENKSTAENNDVNQSNKNTYNIRALKTDKAESPYAECKIKNITMKALIDTGATINVIDKSTWENLKLEKTNSNTEIVVVNGNTIKSEGKTIIEIIITKTKYKLNFEIFPNLNEKIILGMPAINEIGIQKLLKLSTITKDEKMYIINDTTIHPETCTIIHVKIKNENFEETTVMTEIKPYWKQSNLILTMNQLATVKNNKIPVIMLNVGRNPVQLKKDTCIGYVNSIREINENAIIIEGEEIIPEDAEWEDNLPNYPQPKGNCLQRKEFEELIDFSSSAFSEENCKKLKDTLWNRREALYEYDGKNGLYNGNQKLQIKLKNKDIPKRIQPAKMSREKEQEVSKQIADMLENGMIEPSRSPYLSRVVLVKKKDQKWRFVVDFRNTNKLVEQQSHVIPRIDRITQEAAGKKYYTSLDLKAGFHQIPLDEESRKIAAFITHEGIFQYKVMPMGLTGSPDKFQEIMEEILHDIQGCHVYIDDILLCSNEEESHLKNIDFILHKLITNGMKITLKKCQFGQDKVKYLGFILNNQGIHPDPNKIKAINEKQIPKSYKEVKSFIGAASYFRKHIRNFSQIADPLFKLNKDFIWKEEHTIAFNKLKEALVNATIIATPDPLLNYTIFTDASFQGLGAALVQNGKPIAFVSRSLKPAEKNYPIIKLEALGMVYALKQFRPYIYGKHTTVITDHKPLLSLIKNKELTGILQRYQMAIMEYDLTIQHIKGEENKVADYLSREQFMVVNVKKDLMSDAFPEMDTEYSQPYDTEKFDKYLKEEEETQKIDKEGRTKTSYGSRIYVPEVLREQLLIRFHNHPFLGNHMNFKKIEKKFKEVFYWPKMEKDMIQIWTSCDTCARNKEQPARLVKTKMRNLQRPPEAWYTLNADFMQIGKEYILVIVDEYSKFICASINKKQNGTTLKRRFIEIFSLIGFPNTIRSDNGPAFLSKDLTEFFKEMGINHQISSPYNHKSNGIVERFNRTLREALRIRKDIPIEKTIHHTIYVYNRSVNSSGLSPAQIILNTPDRFTNETGIHNGYSGIHKLYKEINDKHNKERNGLIIKPGDKVLRKILQRKDNSKSMKDQATWEGPFEVVKKLYGDTYEIRNIGRGRKARTSIMKEHGFRLKKYVEPRKLLKKGMSNDQ